mmetsp:Transcript_61708/g.172379  ORF Transcript_61708/g.172379 Transcript_61708/m.172379 type:complete len:316 (+) Transcript_61708:641-1588(+)
MSRSCCLFCSSNFFSSACFCFTARRSSSSSASEEEALEPSTSMFSKSVFAAFRGRSTRPDAGAGVLAARVRADGGFALGALGALAGVIRFGVDAVRAAGMSWLLGWRTQTMISSPVRSALRVQTRRLKSAVGASARQQFNARRPVESHLSSKPGASKPCPIYLAMEPSTLRTPYLLVSQRPWIARSSCFGTAADGVSLASGTATAAAATTLALGGRTQAIQSWPMASSSRVQCKMRPLGTSARQLLNAMRPSSLSCSRIGWPSGKRSCFTKPPTTCSGPRRLVSQQPSSAKRISDLSLAGKPRGSKGTASALAGT